MEEYPSGVVTPMVGRWPARPTTYNGVRMRSRSEAKVAAQLDRWGIRWAYEPRCYANASGQYLPDFELLSRMAGDPPVRPIFVEVKPRMGQNLRPIEERMEIIWSSEPEAGLCIWLVDSEGAWMARAVHAGSDWYDCETEDES